MMLDRQLRDLAEVLDEKCIAEYQQGFGLLSLHLRKRGPELGKCADLYQMHAHAMIVRYGADAFLERHVIDISRIGQDPKPRDARQGRLDHLHMLREQIAENSRKPGEILPRPGEVLCK